MIKKYYPLKAKHLTGDDIDINEIYSGETMDFTDMERYIAMANMIVREALRKHIHG